MAFFKCSITYYHNHHLQKQRTDVATCVLVQMSQTVNYPHSHPFTIRFLLCLLLILPEPFRQCHTTFLLHLGDKYATSPIFACTCKHSHTHSFHIPTFTFACLIFHTLTHSTSHVMLTLQVLYSQLFVTVCDRFACAHLLSSTSPVHAIAIGLALFMRLHIWSCTSCSHFKLHTVICSWLSVTASPVPTCCHQHHLSNMWSLSHFRPYHAHASSCVQSFVHDHLWAFLLVPTCVVTITCLTCGRGHISTLASILCGWRIGGLE